MPVMVDREGNTKRKTASVDPDDLVEDVAPPAGSLVDDAGQFETLDAPTLKRGLPLINARVVYLGGNPNRSVAFPGRIDVEAFQEAVPVSPQYPKGIKETLVEKVSPDGITSYDFRLRDALGRFIAERTMPSTSPYAGRIFAPVRHPIHLHNFFRSKMEGGADEFAVQVDSAYRQVLQEFIFKQERAETGLTQQIEDTVKQ